MEIIYFLMPIALLLGSAFVVAFVLAASSGQYDDLETPKHKIFLEPEIAKDDDRE